MSQASVITKSPKSQASSRVIAVETITNPYDVNSANYITNIDSAIVLSKDGKNLGNIKVLDVANEPIPSWKGDYNTDIGNANVYNNLGITAGSSVKVVILEDPRYARDDIGASLISGGSDQTHKTHVTHLENVLALVDAGVSFPSDVSPYTENAMSIMDPRSGRHLCIDKFGTLHLVYSKDVGGVARIVHAWSSTGGDSWDGEYVDPGVLGYSYAEPSISADNQGGLHLFFSVFTAYNPFTYLYYVGSSTPSGWTLMSDVGGAFYNRFILSGDTVIQALSDAPNPAHGVTALDKDVHGYAVCTNTGITCQTDAGPNSLVSSCAVHSINAPVNYDWAYQSTSLVPPYRTAKLIRFPGVPRVIPKDALVMFASALPAGFTRASEYDGVFIRCSLTVGSTGGALTHKHRIWGTTGDSGSNYFNGGDANYITSKHTHTYDGNVTHNNDPSAYAFILGKADNDTTVIPQDAVFMFDRWPKSAHWNRLSEAAGPLYYKMHKGAAVCADAGGSQKHGTAEWDIPTNTQASAGGGAAQGGGCMSNHGHSHLFRVKLEDNWSFPAVFELLTCIANTSFTPVPLDIYYTYKPPGAVWTAPVNISNSGNDFSKQGLSSLCGSNGYVHLVYEDYSNSTVNAVTTERTILSGIKYIRKTNSWQPVENVSTLTTKQYTTPSIDADKSNNVHAAWSNLTDRNEILYRLRNESTGMWAAIEQAATSASPIAETSNIVVMDNADVFLNYNELNTTTNVRERCIANKKSGVWQSPVKLTDRAAAGYDQYSGQMFRDKDEGLLTIWGGKGYGANPTYWRIVYRYISKDGTITPPIASPPSEAFQNIAQNDAYPVVFWNHAPDTDNVYTNTMVDGMAFCYLSNIRGSPEMADIMFNSSEFAVVGQGKGILQKSTSLIINRGNICRTRISPARSYSKAIR